VHRKNRAAPKKSKTQIATVAITHLTNSPLALIFASPVRSRERLLVRIVIVFLVKWAARLGQVVFHVLSDAVHVSLSNGLDALRS
jgi:hypothetical protein